MEGKRLVPWFSMQEWKYVREQIYSSESPCLEKGYQMLQMWKARCPILPVGVECTMEVLKVMLEDKIANTNGQSEGYPMKAVSSIELVYSSVIMRFLNFVTELKSAEVSTIYKAASELNIPDWIVNIRHDAAHGRNVPPLSLLRSAVEFIFNWLYENYWSDEADASQGYSVPEEGEIDWKNKLTNLIHYYTSISRFCQSGISTLDQLRTFPEGVTLHQKLYEAELLQSFQLASDCVLLTDVRQKLLRRLQRAIQQRSSRVKHDEALIELLTSESTSLLTTDTSDKRIISKEKFEMWWEIVKYLSGSTFYDLLVTLKKISKTENENDCAKMAALWLSEFFRVIKNSLSNTIEDDKETLSSNQIPDNDKIQALIKDACLNPDRMTPHYLPRLLGLSESKVDRKKKKMIIELHNIYSGRKTNDAEENEVVHSLENLLLGETSEEMANEEEEEEEEEPKSPANQLPGPFGIWRRAQGDFGWNACPLGVVPWQRQQTLPNWTALATL